MRGLSLGLRLTVMVGVGSFLILSLITAYFYVAARGILVEELEAKAMHLSASTASRIETVERAVEKVALELGVVLGEVEWGRSRVFNLLRNTVDAHKEIYGSAIAFHPDFLPSQAHYRAPYVFRDGDTLAALDLGEGDYGYQIQDWYLLPMELGRPVWSEPYFDEDGGNVLMVTYSVPFRTPWSAPAFAGVITADISLQWLREYLASLPLEENSFGFLVSRIGTMISHPEDDYIMNESVFSLAEARGDTALRNLGKRMVRGETGFQEYTSLAGDEGWLVFTPVPTTEMALGVFFDRRQLMAKVWSLSRTVLVIGTLGSALLLLTIAVVVRRITRPVRALTEAARTMSTGDLDVAFPEQEGKDEIGELSEAFAKMRDDLKLHIAEALEKKRMEGQLQVARTIQQGLLPAVIPFTPGLEVAGDSIFCLEIAGDYYDVIPLPEGRTALALGDVSGKGAGAALIMASVQTALRSLMDSDRPLGETVSRMNDVLEHNTPSGDFITFFVAVFDPKNASLTYVNAGHNPPLVRRRDGGLEELRQGGLVLGAMPGILYREERIPFGPGDTLFAYSDGLSEIMNEDDEEFGEERVRAFLAGNAGLAPDEFLVRIRREAVRFGGRETFDDDFTMLFARGLPESREEGPEGRKETA